MRGVSDESRQREAKRQQQLLEALFTGGAAPPRDALPGWQRGMAAYRANAAAHASDALRAQYPTLLAMLGDAAFDALAAAHWREVPPTRGDLAQFGDAFPQWVRQRDDLATWPWLGDCACLDRALWQVQFAPPAALADADLQRLAGGDPDALLLRLAPATRLVESDWAIVRLRELHATAAPDTEAIAQALRAEAQAAWVWRQGFDTRCLAIDADGVRWLRALREAPTLGAALECAGAGFDAGAWLGDAVRAGWIDGIDAVTTKENLA